MKHDLQDIIKEASKVFSEEFNFEKTIEESAETIHAIQKYKDKKTIENYIKIYGELVDLAICVLIAKENFENDPNLKAIISDIHKEKIDRFSSRIEAKKIK